MSNQNTAWQIREFHFPDDYEAVIELWKNAGPGVHVAKSDTREEMQKKLTRDPDLFLVAELDGEIVGTVIGGFDGRRGMIYHLAVAEKLRRKHIGGALMAEVESRLKSRGCIKAYLLLVKGNNEAKRFYQKRGWQKMKVDAYGKDLE